MRSRSELVAEIERVKAALSKTDSRKLKHDYGKHLERLTRDLMYYDTKAQQKAVLING